MVSDLKLVGVTNAGFPDVVKSAWEKLVRSSDAI
jgi:hypothetical protein